MVKTYNVVYMGKDGYKRITLTANSERGAIRKAGFVRESKHDKVIAEEVKDAEGRHNPPATEHRE